MLNKIFYNLADARIACNQRFVSRASTATYIDDNGVLQTAGINVPRYQNGALLVEGAATNLLEYGDVETDFSGWSEGSGVNSLVRDNTVAFHGTYSAKYTKTAPANGGPFWRNIDNTQIGVTSNSPYTMSFEVYGDSGSVGKYFSPAIEWHSSSGSLISIATAPSFPIVLGWQRIVFSATSAPGSVTGVPECYEGFPSNSGTNWNVWFDCVQFEAGNSASSIIPTTNAPATRAADIIAWV